MASACVNNSISVAPEKFPSYGWLSPRISLSREEDPSKKPSSVEEEPLSDGADPVDFEFRLEDPVGMLPADELFSDGKLVPLHLSSLKPSKVAIKSSSPDEPSKSCNISSFDPYLFSPKAPRCSSRWKELLGLKKLYHNSAAATSKTDPSRTSSFLSSSSSSSATTHAKSSLKHFLHRSSKSSSSSSCSVSSSLEGSLNLPLLAKDSDSESVSLSSSRLSLSSSSSGHEHEDLPRLSLDSDKPTLNPNPNPNPNPFANPPRMRLVKPRECSHNHSSAATARAGRSPIRSEQAAEPSRGVSVDSPRMNSSGKIVFQSLERSSSSPSSFNGGPRYKHRGMERSYSANVRVTPVLNMPVCSLRGSSKSGSVFGFFSAPLKNGTSNGATATTVRHQSNSRNRTDRT